MIRRRGWERERRQRSLGRLCRQGLRPRLKGGCGRALRSGGLLLH